MKTINTEELKTILENHKHWLNMDCKGWKNMRADLRGVNLSGANNVPYIPMVCPEEGNFIGWKKAKITKKNVNVGLLLRKVQSSDTSMAISNLPKQKS